MDIGLKNISKKYGNMTVFDNADFDFSTCGLYVLTGKSGGGKTTLLNIIAGYESVDEGERRIDANIDIACIFQSYELFPTLTVQQNIYMVSTLFDQELTDVHHKIIEMLGLDKLMDHYPDELSQGQKQRVGIARALWGHPDIILCDEPTESLDIENKEIVLQLLKELAREKIVIVTSHDTHLMQQYYDYYYCIENKNIILQEKRTSGSTLSLHKETNKVNTHVLKQYLHKIIHKKSLLQMILLVILVAFQVVMAMLDVQVFNDTISMEAANSHTIYTKDYGTSIPLLQSYGELFPVVSFLPLEMQGRTYKVHVYPMLEKDKKIKELKDKEIVINQNVAAILKQQNPKEAISQKSLALSYIMDGVSYKEEFTIVDVVAEKDTSSMQIYYSYEGMNQLLQKKIGNDIYATQYDYLQEQADTYALLCPNNTVKDTFQILQEDKQVSVYHSIFTEQLQNSGDSYLYQLLFRLLQICVLLCTIGYTIYYAIKDTNIYAFALSLLHAIGVPLELIKQMFFKEKCKYLLGLCIVPSISMLVMFFLQMEIKYYVVMLGYTICIAILYIFTLKIKLCAFTKHKISLILKEDKDR